MGTRKAIFLDKDGTLVNDVPYNIDPDRLTLSRNAGQGLRLFKQSGYLLLVVSNQPGVALGHFHESKLHGVWRRLDELLQAQSVELDGYYYCPHHIAGSVGAYSHSCGCRKPLPGMLLQAAAEHDVDLGASWMVGDILHDMEAGRRAGCKTILIDNGNETEWNLSPLCMPDLLACDLYDAALQVATAQPATAQPITAQPITAEPTIAQKNRDSMMSEVQ